MGDKWAAFMRSPEAVRDPAPNTTEAATGVSVSGTAPSLVTHQIPSWQCNSLQLIRVLPWASLIIEVHYPIRLDQIGVGTDERKRIAVAATLHGSSSSRR